MIYGEFPARMCDYLREHGVNNFELPGKCSNTNNNRTTFPLTLDLEDISNSQASVPDMLLRKVHTKVLAQFLHLIGFKEEGDPQTPK